MKKALVIGLMATVAVVMAACGKEKSSDEGTTAGGETTGDAVVSEDNFEWDGNIITGLSEKGKEQKVLVIPEKCEGFRDGLFTGDEVDNATQVSFESDEDIDIGLSLNFNSNLEKVELPEKLVLTGDEFFDFSACPSLKSINIPAGVTEVPAYCFQGCEALENVEFEGNEVSIGMHAFERCSSLENISFPESVPTIGEYAFWKCTSLKKVTLSKTVGAIGGSAFLQTGLNELYIPSSVQIEPLSNYDTTAFLPADGHMISIYVVKDSWSDKNFDTVFDSVVFEKKYYEE